MPKLNINAVIVTRNDRKKEVMLTLSVEGVPHVTTFQLNPTDARGLAALLLDAAVQCEQVIVMPGAVSKTPAPA